MKGPVLWEDNLAGLCLEVEDWKEQKEQKGFLLKEHTAVCGP